MEKKHLTRNILITLAMTATVPAGQAWAAEWSNPDEYVISDDGTTLTVNTSNTVREDSTFNGKGLDKFSTVNIVYIPTGNAGGNRAMGIYSASYKLSNTDIVVNIEDTGYSNNDGLHLTNHFPSYAVRSYNATIKADNSDALI